MPFLLRFNTSRGAGTRVALADRNGKLLRQPDLREVGYFSAAPGGLIAPARAVDGKWGYISGQGTWLIQPQFDDARSFSRDGLARCSKDDKWGFVDLHGALCISPRYDYASSFHHGLAAVRIARKWGAVDTSGAIAIEPLYKLVGEFSPLGLAPFSNDKLWGYIDRNGKVIISPQFAAAKSFGPGGLAPVRNDRDRWGLIDGKGQWAVSPKYSHIKEYNNDGLALFTLGTEARGYLNASGKEVFTASKHLSEHMNCGMVRDSYYNIGFYNKDGILAIPKQFQWVGNFGDRGGAIGRREGVWGIVWLDGRFEASGRLEPVTDSAWQLEGFDQNGLSGWITAQGDIEWIDLDGQLRFRAVQTGTGIALGNDRGETIWQSEASPSAMNLAGPVLEAGPKRLFNDIVETAQKILSASPREFSPCSLVFENRDDPYDLKEIMEDLDEQGLDEDERREELQARVRYGALAVLAQTYVGEGRWGTYEFLETQRGDAFGAFFETLKERLTAAFGTPDMERVWPGTKRRMRLAGGDLTKTACWPNAGGATLVLEWFSRSGDGDFEHQILLAALREDSCS